MQYLPLEITECRYLQVLDLAHTYVKILPIEICQLKQLYDLNLTGCPLEPTLEVVSKKGIVALLKHYADKLQRENFREKIVNAAREELWLDTPISIIQEVIGKVLESLETDDISLLQRLLRNLKYVLPENIVDVDPFMIKISLSTSKVKSGSIHHTKSAMNNSISKSFNVRGKGTYPGFTGQTDTIRQTASVEGSQVNPADMASDLINIQSNIVEGQSGVQENPAHEMKAQPEIVAPELTGVQKKVVETKGETKKPAKDTKKGK